MRLFVQILSKCSKTETSSNMMTIIGIFRLRVWLALAVLGCGGTTSPEAPTLNDPLTRPAASVDERSEITPPSRDTLGRQAREWTFAERSGPFRQVRIGHVTVELPGELPKEPVTESSDYYGIQFGDIRLWTGAFDTANDSDRSALEKRVEEDLKARTASGQNDVIVERHHFREPARKLIRMRSKSGVTAEASIVMVEPSTLR